MTNLIPRNTQASDLEPSVSPAYIRDSVRNMVRACLLKGMDLEYTAYFVQKNTVFKNDVAALAEHFFNIEKG